MNKEDRNGLFAHTEMIRETHYNDRELFSFSGRPKSLTAMLDHSISLYADRECLVDNNTRLTYRQFQKQVDALAYNLKEHWGIENGQRVALILNNTLEFCISFFALVQIGAITVPLNTRLKSDELKFMLQDSGAKMLIMEAEYWEEINPIRCELQSLEAIFMVGEGDMPAEVKLFSELYVDRARERVMAPSHEDETVVIMYTSGTTGVPKGAQGTHLGMIHSAINYKILFSSGPQDRTVLVVPLFHVTGLIGQLIHMVYVGGATVLMKKYKTENMLELMDREEITFSFVVPTIYVLMLLNENLDKYDLSRLRLAAYGGAPMSLETIKELSGLFPSLDLRNAYGATETSSPATIMPPGATMLKSSSVGIPVPGAEVKVVEGEGQELEANQVGELWIKGPMVVPGYWNNDNANKSEFTDGYWHSGDLARIDDDGFVYIMDRKKDVINRGGEKIFCVEVEDVLCGHAKILEAAVVGVSDEVFGEEVKAVVVPKPGSAVLEEEIRDWVGEKLARYKVPKYVRIIDELPRNPGGKVLKAKIVDL